MHIVVPAKTNREAYSLLELLTVVAILALLAGLILAGVQNVRGTAARLDCQNRLKHMALAAQNHHATHKAYPHGVWYPFAKTKLDPEIYQAGISWQTILLPYLEQDAIWREVWVSHTNAPSGDTIAHSRVASHPIVAFRCPADPRPRGYFYTDKSEQLGWGLTNFVGVAGTGMNLYDGVLHPNFAVANIDIRDGSSSTIFVGERPTAMYGYGNSWYSDWGLKRYFRGQLLPVDLRRANEPVDHIICPNNLGVFQAGKYDDPCYQGFFWSRHNGGANFAYADGSVRFLSYSAAAILPALATRSGGESLGD